MLKKLMLASFTFAFIAGIGLEAIAKIQVGGRVRGYYDSKSVTENGESDTDTVVTGALGGDNFLGFDGSTEKDGWKASARFQVDFKEATSGSPQDLTVWDKWVKLENDSFAIQLGREKWGDEAYSGCAACAMSHNLYLSLANDGSNFQSRFNGAGVQFKGLQNIDIRAYIGIDNSGKKNYTSKSSSGAELVYKASGLKVGLGYGTYATKVIDEDGDTDSAEAVAQTTLSLGVGYQLNTILIFFNYQSKSSTKDGDDEANGYTHLNLGTDINFGYGFDITAQYSSKMNQEAAIVENDGPGNSVAQTALSVSGRKKIGAMEVWGGWGSSSKTSDNVNKDGYAASSLGVGMEYNF